MFDYNMILVDGSVDCSAATPASYVAATTTSKTAATGAVVIDLGTGGTPVSGLAAVLFIPALTSSTDHLAALIQVCDEVGFAGATYYPHNVVVFDIAAVTTGRILASECTSARIVVARFATDKRYVRANLTPTHVGGVEGNMGKVKVYLAPFPFVLL